jgi:hypothetical protein
MFFNVSSSWLESYVLFAPKEMESILELISFYPIVYIRQNFLRIKAEIYSDLRFQHKAMQF